MNAQFGSDRAITPGNLLRNLGITSSRRLLSEVAIPNTTLSGTQADGVGNSFQAVVAMYKDFDAVRVIFHNAHSAGYDIKVGFFAASNADMTHASNFPTALVGSQTVAVAAGAGTASAAAAVFTNTASTWVPLSSIPRTDGGVFPLLGIRTYVPNPGAGSGTVTTCHTGSNTVMADFNANYANGKVWYSRKQSHKDAVTTPTDYNVGGSFDVGPVCPAFTVQARMRGQAITVMNVGDSTFSGNHNTTTGQWNNWLFRGCDLVTTSTLPVVPLNQGIASQTEANYLLNGRAMLESVVPDIAIFHSSSVNNGALDAARVLADISNTFSFIELCRQNGIVPVVTTMWPLAANTNAGGFQASFNAKIRGLTGINILDLDAICGTGAADDRVWLSDYSDDNTHPSYLAETAVAAELANVIRRILMQNGLA